MHHPFHHLIQSLRRLGCLVCAALLSSAALAQSPAGKPPPRPPCYPGINGYPVGVPHIEYGSVGVHTFIGCRDPKTQKVVLNGVSCQHGECSDAIMGAVIYNVTRASGKVAAANAAWDKYVKLDCDIDTSPLCLERVQILRANRARWVQ